MVNVVVAASVFLLFPVLTWAPLPVAEPGLSGLSLAPPAAAPRQHQDAPLAGLEAAPAAAAAGRPRAEVAPLAVHTAVCFLVFFECML